MNTNQSPNVTSFDKLTKLKDCTDVATLQAMVEALYQALDDIDTSTDMLSRVCSGSDDFNRRFYLLTMKRVQECRNRHLISDGHDLFLKSNANEVWTCYPFRELGDKPYTKILPPRKVVLISHDGNKYANVDFQGTQLDLKWGYLSLTEEDAENLEKNYVTLQWLQDNKIPEVD